MAKEETDPFQGLQLSKLDITPGKVELSTARQASSADDQELAVIVKVNVADYVPPGFTVRTRIDEYLFTADSTNRSLREAATNSYVESISPARPLKRVDSQE